MTFRPIGLVVVVFSAALGACSVPDTPVEIHDPYESLNRRTHDFNVHVDKAVIRPAARAYGDGLPGTIKSGVSNVSDFLNTPRYIVNDLAQGNVQDAGHNFARLVVNTVFGFGLLDSATGMGMERRSTGFAETLFVWGTPEGAYVVVPVIGPSTERGVAGGVVDLATDPVGYALEKGSRWLQPATSVGTALETRHRLGDTIDGLLDSSADSYAQTRNFYLQNRRFNLGQEDEFAFDPYEDLSDEN